MHEITRMLDEIEQRKGSAEDLLPLVYEELRKLATIRMANEGVVLPTLWISFWLIYGQVAPKYRSLASPPLFPVGDDK